jgi:hypothetical protein
VLAVSLASALENAASALPELSDAVRPANGDPEKLLANLDAAGAGRVLEWLLRHEPTAGAELAAAFLDAPEGGAPLLALRDVELPKEGRKVLRRVLHRLRSRGEDVSEAPAPRVARLAPLEDTLGGAFVSALDPSGARLVVLVEPHPSSGARLFEVVVDEARGVLDFHAFVTGRSKARSFLRELQVRDRWSVVEVPRSAAEALLARMAAPGSDRAAPPREFGAWRSRLATPEEGAKSPGELAREALDEAGHAGALERAVALVKEQEIGPWPPAVGTLEEMAAALKDAAEGRVIVAAWRLRETAYVFWKREREGDARACLAAARAFEEQELERNAVARALVERMLGPALEALREEEDPSLLVKGEQPALITKP